MPAPAGTGKGEASKGRGEEKRQRLASSDLNRLRLLPSLDLSRFARYRRLQILSSGSCARIVLALQQRHPHTHPDHGTMHA